MIMRMVTLDEFVSKSYPIKAFTLVHKEKRRKERRKKILKEGKGRKEGKGNKEGRKRGRKKGRKRTHKVPKTRYTQSYSTLCGCWGFELLSSCLNILPVPLNTSKESREPDEAWYQLHQS